MDIRIPIAGGIAAIAISVRLLRQRYHGRQPIPPKLLSTLMKSLTAAGRLSLLGRIRNLAYRSGDSSISTWALAEMIHCETYYIGKLSALLAVFEYHFHLVGVPQSMFKHIFTSPHRLAIPPVKRPPNEIALLGRPPSFRRRLQPTLQHMYVLWRAVIKGVHNPITLSRLYRDFVKTVIASRRLDSSDYPVSPLFPPNAISRSTSYAQDTGYMQPIPPHSLYDIRFFNAFLAQFWHFNSPLHLTRVILDLVCLGFEPDGVTRNIFVHALRLKPDMVDVFRVLTYWERKVDRLCEVLVTMSDDTSPSTSTFAKVDPKRTRQLLLEFFYCCAIQRLTRDGRADHAREVAEHVRGVLPRYEDSKTLRRVVRYASERPLTPAAATASGVPNRSPISDATGVSGV